MFKKRYKKHIFTATIIKNYILSAATIFCIHFHCVVSNSNSTCCKVQTASKNIAQWSNHVYNYHHKILFEFYYNLLNIINKKKNMNITGYVNPNVWNYIEISSDDTLLNIQNSSTQINDCCYYNSLLFKKVGFCLALGADTVVLKEQMKKDMDFLLNHNIKKKKIKQKYSPDVFDMKPQKSKNQIFKDRKHMIGYCTENKDFLKMNKIEEEIFGKDCDKEVFLKSKKSFERQCLWFFFQIKT